MELIELQKQISDIFNFYLNQHGIKMSEDYLQIKLTEEVGEFMQAYLIHNKNCRQEKYLPEVESKRKMAIELSDVVCLCLVIANQMNIDLAEAITKKWITREWIKETK